MKLFHKFSFSIVALLVFVIGGIGILTLVTERSLLQSEMENHFREVIRRLARVCEESLYQNDLVVFNYLKGLESERGFVEAYFEDNQGKIRVHSIPRLIGTKLPHPTLEAENGEDVIQDTVLSPIGTPYWVYKTRVFYGETKVGWAVLTLNKSELENFIRASLKKNIHKWIPIGMLSLILGLLGSLILARTLTQPIKTIVNQVEQVGEGRREVFREDNRKDELGLIPIELNKMIHKLKELDQMKSEFVSAVTHELRSPLTAIEQFVSLMLKGTYGPLTNNQQETLITIKNNSIRLAQFIDDVLTSSKLESRKFDVFLETFDIRETTDDIKKLFEPIAKEKNLGFSTNNPSRPILVEADRTMTRHILTNLVSNALKFTDKGKVQVNVSETKTKVQVDVIDTGHGIPEKDKAQIFEKFYRSLSTATKTKGTGLGLFIVKSFIDAQKGRIELHDNPDGPGTMISIFLPKAKM